MAVISVSYLHASNLSLYFGYLEVVSSSSDLHRESADVLSMYSLMYWLSHLPAEKKSSAVYILCEDVESILLSCQIWKRVKFPSLQDIPEIQFWIK